MSFERDPNDILKELRIFHFPDEEIMDVEMIAVSIRKSPRTAYRLLENGDIPIAAGTGKFGAKAKDVKSWVLRKYEAVPKGTRRKPRIRWIYMKDNRIACDPPGISRKDPILN